MVQIINCPTANLPLGMFLVACQNFFDPAYDHPVHYLYKDKTTLEQHCQKLTEKRKTITLLGGPFYTVVEESVYNDIIKSDGVLEGSCQNTPPPFPYDQDEV